MAAHSISNKAFDRLPFQGGDSFSLGATLKRLLASVELWWFKRQTFQATLKELEGLKDRELDDVGILRADIRSIAWESAEIAASTRR